MTLEPSKDLTRCCSRCTKKPFLDGCRTDYACRCHYGHKPARAFTPPVIRDIHRCLEENCDECKTANPFDDPFTP